MGFPEQRPLLFSRIIVEMLPEGRNGCYGLFKEGQWVYVGKGDIRQRLMDHLNGDNPCITRHAPTHVVLDESANMDEREKVLIAELKPTCNQRVG